MPAQPVLTVMARWPSAGRCKRRLANDLCSLPLQHAAERAAHLQQQLLMHTMAVANRLRLQGHLELAIAVSGPHLVEQGDGDALQVDRTVLQRGAPWDAGSHLLMAFGAAIQTWPAVDRDRSSWPVTMICSEQSSSCSRKISFSDRPMTVATG